MDDLLGCIFAVVVMAFIAVGIALYAVAIIILGACVITFGFSICLFGGVGYLVCGGIWKAEKTSHTMMGTWANAQPQPAYKLYALGPGWRAWWYMIPNLAKDISVGTAYCAQQASDISDEAGTHEWYTKIPLYAIAIGWYAAAGGLYAAFALILLLVLSIQALLLALWAVYLRLVIAVLASGTWLISRIYGMFCVCPACSRSMAIGIYVCRTPNCSVEHTNLRPNAFGILRHRCKNCKAYLPTLDCLGRYKLYRKCVACHRPLNIGVGRGTNIYIPLIGGPFAGKTNYLVMAIQEFKRLYGQKLGYEISFTDHEQQVIFEQNMQKMGFGREVNKTPDLVPQAYNIKMRAPRALVPKLAYVYDAAGEMVTTGQNIRQQEHFKYTDGIIFMIDPSSIRSFYQHHQAQIDTVRSSLRPCDVSPVAAFERMLHMFEASVARHRQRKYKQALAIVVTKVDALGLEDEIGAPAARRLMAQNSKFHSEEQAIHYLVREFLCKYESDNFVRLMEAYFPNIRYFSCSSLGRSPSENMQSPFVPVRVLYPLLWLFNQTGAVKKTRQQRYLLESSEPLQMPPLVQ